MPAGSPGDHPLSDVVNFNLEVYGNEADDLLKQLSTLLSKRELDKFWDDEIGWQCSKGIALSKIAEKYNWAKTRAQENGWES